MGYRRKTYRLRWPEGHELSGLEVVLRGMRIGALGKIAGARGIDPESMDLSVIEELSDLFAGHLVEWNYEDEDGTPIPATKASVDDMDVRMMMQVVMKWAEVSADVPSPLPKPSGAGSQYPVALVPMVVK